MNTIATTRPSSRRPTTTGSATRRTAGPFSGSTVPNVAFDLVETVRDGNLLLIPWGYHTTVAAHGHDLYYLNILAGPAPQRTLQGPPGSVPPGDPGHLAGRRDGCQTAHHSPLPRLNPCSPSIPALHSGRKFPCLSLRNPPSG